MASVSLKKPGINAEFYDGTHLFTEIQGEIKYKSLVCIDCQSILLSNIRTNNNKYQKQL